MKKTLQSFLCLLSLVSFSFIISSCSLSSGLSGNSSDAPELTGDGKSIHVLTIGTADSGGTMYPVGSAIAQAISDHDANIKVNTSASNGSFTNVEALRAGQIDLALVSGDVAFCAYNGTEEFAENPSKDLRIIAAVYSSLSNWIAASDSNLIYVHDLKNKNIAVGPKDSTTELSARIALKAVGLDETNTHQINYGLGSGGIEVERGNLDALHGFAGIPINGLSQLANSVPCRILKYTDDELKEILAENQYYYPASIPAGTYKGQLTAVQTFGVKCLVCVSADMSDELVYNLTKILDESRPWFIENYETMASMEMMSFVCQDLPIPLHPGARQYYEEAGYLKK